jgi:hypothetical protein
MNIITIDFETYYDRQYSLSKLTTEEYVRSDDFEVIGVGVKINDLPTVWFSGTMHDIHDFLLECPWEDSIAVAHNAMFDAAILYWHFGIKPVAWFDTLAAARAIDGIEVSGSLKACAERYGIGEKGTEVVAALGKRRVHFTKDELAQYGEYCKNDCDLTFILFLIYGEKVSEVEIKLIDLTVRMFSEPVLELDLPALENHLQSVRDRKEELMLACEAEPEVLQSNPKFAELLRSLGVDPPMKTSPATGKQTYAFAKNDEEFKALLDHEDERVQAVVAARLGTKSTLEETRTERFIEIAKRGSLPVPLRYYAAHTGRWGGCLVADTEVTVYDYLKGVTTKKIVDVMPDDLVWDGEEFVPHEGVQFSGYQEVISWDGIVGTEEHVVFTDAGEISLREAVQGAHRITIARSYTDDDVDSAREFVRNYEK